LCKRRRLLGSQEKQWKQHMHFLHAVHVAATRASIYVLFVQEKFVAMWEDIVIVPKQKF
jgi:hypothetical protein